MRWNVDRQTTQPKSTPTIAVQAIQPLIVRLGTLGVNAAGLVGSVGIDPACIDDPDGRVPLALLDPLWERAAEETGDDCFGLHTAELVGPYSFGIISYLGVTSSTWGEGIRRVCTCFPLFSDASNYHLDSGFDSASLIATQKVVGGDSIRQRSEFTMAVMYCYGKRYIARPWKAIEVCFEHPKPFQTVEHERIFRAPLRFSSSRMSFSFPGELLAAPLKTADSILAAHFFRIANELFCKDPYEADFVRRVKETIVAWLQGGEISLQAIARHMAMSPRSMQRRLEQHGYSYQGLLDHVRCEVATSLLVQPRVSMLEVGFLLGFSEPAAFYRAFKRWTGMTPAKYRESIKERYGKSCACSPPGMPTKRPRQSRRTRLGSLAK